METLVYKGEQLQVSITDDQAAEILRRVPQATRPYQMASNLLADYERYRGRLFPSRRYFLHKLAQEQLERETPPTPLSPNGSLPNIANFLTPVSKRIASGANVTFTAGDITVTIRRAGVNSRHPESFYVSRSDSREAGIYMGRIDPAGGFYPTQRCGADVLALLDEFENDPKQYAMAYGVRTGRCCFCATKLEDPISIGIGCGPVCSRHYGIPHGKRALESALRARAEAANGNQPN